MKILLLFVAVMLVHAREECAGFADDDACINESNFAQCQEKVDECGEDNVIVLESCPVQFDCLIVATPCNCGESCKSGDGSYGVCQTDGYTCAQNIVPPDCPETCENGDEEQVEGDPCCFNTCWGGQWSMLCMACELPPCFNYVYIDGECCPVCPEDEDDGDATVCVHEDTFDAGYGECSTYGNGQTNQGYCNGDCYTMYDGTYVCAVDACAECGACTSEEADEYNCYDCVADGGSWQIGECFWSCVVSDTGCFTSASMCDTYYEEQEAVILCEEQTTCADCQAASQYCLWNVNGGGCWMGADYWGPGEYVINQWESCPNVGNEYDGCSPDTCFTTDPVESSNGECSCDPYCPYNNDDISCCENFNEVCLPAEDEWLSESHCNYPWATIPGIELEENKSACMYTFYAVFPGDSCVVTCEGTEWGDVTQPTEVWVCLGDDNWELLTEQIECGDAVDDECTVEEAQNNYMNCPVAKCASAPQNVIDQCPDSYQIIDEVDTNYEGCCLKLCNWGCPDTPIDEGCTVKKAQNNLACPVAMCADAPQEVKDMCPNSYDMIDEINKFEYDTYGECCLTLCNWGCPNGPEDPCANTICDACPSGMESHEDGSCCGHCEVADCSYYDGNKDGCKSMEGCMWKSNKDTCKVDDSPVAATCADYTKKGDCTGAECSWDKDTKVCSEPVTTCSGHAKKGDCINSDLMCSWDKNAKECYDQVTSCSEFTKKGDCINDNELWCDWDKDSKTCFDHVVVCSDYSGQKGSCIDVYDDLDCVWDKTTKLCSDFVVSCKDYSQDDCKAAENCEWKSNKNKCKDK